MEEIKKIVAAFLLGALISGTVVYFAKPSQNEISKKESVEENKKTVENDSKKDSTQNDITTVIVEEKDKDGKTKKTTTVVDKSKKDSSENKNKEIVDQSKKESSEVKIFPTTKDWIGGVLASRSVPEFATDKTVYTLLVGKKLIGTDKLDVWAILGYSTDDRIYAGLLAEH